MDRLPEEGIRPFYPKGLAVLLVRRGGELFALSNRCPHLGCPLSQGKLEGDVIRCPCHDWTFDVRTGELTMSREVKVATFPTKVESGKAYVLLEV
ncbi:MAG: Sulredoxin [Methanomassiliicoccales archaeon PtaU1.Bin124]|nr:MAG: Sulredoxin [Methanomassiliicoccales archaeon PtaU1.Bin124]